MKTEEVGIYLSKEVAKKGICKWEDRQYFYFSKFEHCLEIM